VSPKHGFWTYKSPVVSYGNTERTRAQRILRRNLFSKHLLGRATEIERFNLERQHFKVALESTVRIIFAVIGRSNGGDLQILIPIGMTDDDFGVDRSVFVPFANDQNRVPHLLSPIAQDGL